MFKFDSTPTLYSNYLDVINPKILPVDNTPDEVRISYNNSGKKETKIKAVSSAIVSSSRPLVTTRDVDIISKVEASFHCLVSKIHKDYPNLQDENFLQLGQKIEGNDDATIVIKEIYNILRLIRNKFHHDKSGGLSWDKESNLIVKGDEELIISEHAVKLCVYIVWYCFKNNMKHLYNRIVLNYLYAALHSGVKKISYGNRKNKTNTLKRINNPWRVNTNYFVRNIVTGDIFKKVEGGYKIDRQKCLYTYTDNESGEPKLIECLYRRLDYKFDINDIEYLIPDEFFIHYKDGEEAFISSEDLEKFIYLPMEIAKF